MAEPQVKQIKVIVSKGSNPEEDFQKKMNEALIEG